MACRGVMDEYGQDVVCHCAYDVRSIWRALNDFLFNGWAIDLDMVTERANKSLTEYMNMHEFGVEKDSGQSVKWKRGSRLY